MAELDEESRQSLKLSVARAMRSGGQGKKSRKAFKKAVAKSINKQSTATLIKRNMQIDTALELIEELWKEVVNESQT